MYHDKEKLATLLFETLDNLILEDEKHNVSIDRLLNPQQKYSLIMTIINNLPVSNLERVIDFHDKFKVPKEKTKDVTEFEFSELRFRLLLEEVLELGKALGLKEMYNIFVNVYTKIKDEPEIPNDQKLKEVFDALLDIQFVTEGAIDVFNLTDIIHEGQEEVYNSNMSKLIPNNSKAIEIIKASRENYEKENISTITDDLKNGYHAIKNKETGKILKPVSYNKPNIEEIINNFKN